MPKHKKSRRGVEARDIGNFQYEWQSDPPSVARRPAAHRRNAVDPFVLKRAYMLHNFQFVLRRDVQGIKTTPGLPQGQRRLQEALLSSDTVPPWEAVTAVVVRWTLEEFQCPICFETPAAARIADCGHAFCLSCMLQYLSRRKAEGKQRTCPVCHNYLSLSMLRPCVLRPIQPPAVGKRASFTLLRRQGNSCVVLRQDDPRWSDAPPLEDELPLPSQGEPSATFCRYILATAESEETQRCQDCAGIMDHLSNIDTHSRPFTQFDDEVQRFSEEALNMVLQDSAVPPPSSPPPAGIRSSPPIAPKRPDMDVAATYDLYGESEGQPYYLHPITFKMLREDAKTRQMPIAVVVEAPVEEIVTFTQDEASRRQFKAFAHVPLHGTIKLCVLDLTDVVLPSTLEVFAPSLSRLREARRNRETNDISSGGEDTSWQEYLRRYRAGSSAVGADAELSPEFLPSDFSSVHERLPSLELPSSGVTASSEPGGLSGDSSLATRQRATKKQENPIPSCWSAENSRKLFSTPPARPVAPTWGGHTFNLHKPPSTAPFAQKQ